MKRTVARIHIRNGLCLVVVLSPLPTTASAGVAIFGGLTYDQITQSGYLSPTLPLTPGSTAGPGFAAGYVSKTVNGNDVGMRGMRWDGAGNATELAPLNTRSDGHGRSQAYAVGSNGTAVGSSEKWGTLPWSQGIRAVRWQAGVTSPTELGTLGTRSDGQGAASASAINADGTIVGWSIKYSATTNFGERAVRWDAGTNTATELGHLGLDANGKTTSRALAVNASGVSIGFAFRYEGANFFGRAPVRWNAGTTIATELLGLGSGPGGAVSSGALAINDAGTIAGSSHKVVNGNDAGQRAVRWDPGSIEAVELDSLGTNTSGFTFSEAYGINAEGTLIGSATKWSGDTDLGLRAVRWDAGQTTVTELGNLGTAPDGKTYTGVFAINQVGAAVGQAHAYDSSGAFKHIAAVAWGADGAAIDLNTLLSANSGWVNVYDAKGLDATGWVSGIGRFDPDSEGPLSFYNRAWLMLVPQLGTYGRGDANFDTHINFDDLLLLAQHYGQDNPTNDVHVADLNLDGHVNFDDLLTLAQHYESTAILDGSPFNSSFTTDWTLARSLVPEPAMLLSIGLFCRPLRRRR